MAHLLVEAGVGDAAEEAVVVAWARDEVVLGTMEEEQGGILGELHRVVIHWMS